MYQDEDVESLRELVNDERARRVYAEEQLAAERRRADHLRSPATERGPTSHRGTRRGVRSWLLGRWRRARKASPTAGSSTEPPGPPPPTLPPYQPTLRVAAWDGPGWLSKAADCVELARNQDSLASADMVFVAGPGGLAVLGDWLTWPARQPLVFWDWEGDETKEWAKYLSERDLVVGPEQLGLARTIDSWPVLDPREVRPGLFESEGSAVATAATPLSEIVVRALLRSPMQLGEMQLAPELDGMVVSASDDTEKAGVISRLLAAERHNPGAAITRIADQVGINLPSLTPSVGILLVSRRPDRAAGALEQISHLRYPALEVVVGLHGVGPVNEIRAVAEVLGIEDRVRFLEFDEHLSLGECLNRAAEATGASILAKFDDDDRYGRWYLDEAVDELTATGADLVGKTTQYVHLSQSDQLILYRPGKEHSETAYVNGPTFVMPRHTWERVGFPHRRSRVDSVFVRGLKAIGGTIRSSSRFEFILGRHGEGHTWVASDERFLASGEVVGRGSDEAMVWLDQL